MASTTVIPQRGAVPFDSSRKLFFGMKAAWLIQQRYGPGWMQELYELGKGADKSPQLKNPEALCFFLWAGLQQDAKERGDDITLEQVEAAITPFTLQPLFTRVSTALMLGVVTPVQLGKTEATGPAAKPAAATGPGPTRVSTSMKRRASRTASSGGRRSGSGRSR